MDSLDFELHDERATEALGQGLARVLPRTPAGVVVYLHGDVGAGKTTCVRSFLRALGVPGVVRSPTYTLVETYSLSGGLTCVHVDLYRLRSILEVEELGLRDASGSGQVLLIEWPEKGGSLLPAPDLDVFLSYAGDGRAAQLRAATPVGRRCLRDLGNDTRLAGYVSNLT